MEGYVSVATMLAEGTHEDVIAVHRLALTLGDPIGKPILALELGQATGCPVRNSDGAIASGIAEFGSIRFEGGGKADALALLVFDSGSRRSAMRAEQLLEQAASTSTDAAEPTASRPSCSST
jgi:hypothetical protein